MSKLKNISINKVIETIKHSVNFALVCKILECSDNSSNRQYLQDIVEKHKINISHFKKIKTPINRQQYQENPKKCKYCGTIIPFERRQNDFCNHSCAASYNLEICRNKEVTTLIDRFSDEEFISIINTTTTWKLIVEAFGYNGVNQSNKTIILNRCKLLNISPNVKTNHRDWSIITKGLLFDECKNWLSARTMIRKLAQKSFENSNKEYKCAICGYDKHVEIAHIKAVSEFSKDATITEINDPSNLIGLCPNHHWEYDNGILKLE